MVIFFLDKFSQFFWTKIGGIFWIFGFSTSLNLINFSFFSRPNFHSHNIE
jgi:hypothetical protein